MPKVNIHAGHCHMMAVVTHSQQLIKLPNLSPFESCRLPSQKLGKRKEKTVT